MNIVIAYGVFGALIVGVLAVGAILAIGQIIFATERTPLIHVVMGLLVAVSTTNAGHHRTLRLPHIGVPSGGWRRPWRSSARFLLVARHGRA
jgi:hypothetical protein